MANEVVTKFTADTEGLEAGIRKAQTSIDNVAASAKKANTTVAQTDGSLKSFGDNAGKVGGNVSKLNGILSKLSPGASNVAGSIADLADVAEVGSVTIGALGISAGVALSVIAALGAVLLPVAGYFAVMKREADEAASRTEFLAEHADNLSGLMKDLETATLDAAVATGRLSEKEAEYVRNQDAATEALKNFQDAQKGEKKSAEDSYFANKKVMDRLEQLPDFLSTAIDYYGGYSSAMNEASWELDQLAGEERNAQDVIVKTKEATDEGTKAKNHSAAASKNKADREKEETEVLKALNAQMQAQNDLAASNVSVYNAAIQTMQGLEDSDKKAVLTKQELLDAEHAEALQFIKDQQNKALAVSDSVSARETIEQTGRDASKAEIDRYNKEVAELNAKAALDEADAEAKRLEDLSEARKQALENDVELQQQYRDVGVAIAQESLDIIKGFANDELQARTDTIEALQDELEKGEDTLTEKQKEALQTRIDANKKAALEAFNVAKAVAAAQAAISTALAVINALASPVPYPVAIGFAVAAGIAGAASTAAILSEKPPTFHTGGSFSDRGNMSPDERDVRMTTQEAMLTGNGRATLGDDTIKDLNAGRGLGSTGATYIVYKHKAFEYFMKDNINMNGTISKTIRKGDRVGHIRRGRGRV